MDLIQVNENILCVCVCACVCVCVCVCRVRRAAARCTVHTHTTGSKLRCQTPIKHTTNISEPPRISVKYISILPDNESYTIQNMPETCRNDF